MFMDKSQQMNGTSGQTITRLLLSPREAAKLLSISERTLFTLTKAGEIRAVRFGRNVRYDPADLRAWIESAKNVKTAS